MKKARSSKAARRRGAPPFRVAAAALAALSVGLLGAGLLTAGCGGGGAHSGDSADLTRSKAGVTFDFHWPTFAPATAGSRAVPESAQSIAVLITDAVGNTQSVIVNRPDSTSTTTVRATFTGLAPGTASVVFVSYTGADGGGTQIDQTPAQTVTLAPGVNNNVVLGYRDVPFTGVVITPGADQTLAKGGTVQLSAAGYNNGNLIQTSPTTGTWTSGNDAVATVSSSGLVTAAGYGSTQITFTAEGQSAVINVTVPAPVYSSIKVTANGSANLLRGQTVQLAATAYDTDGTTVISTNPAGQWSSNNTSAATVDSATGLVTATGVGTATITFTDSTYNKSGALSVTVTIPYASVAVTPPAPTVLQGQTVALSATAYDTDNTTVLSTAPAGTWSTDNPNVATVDGHGVVTGVFPGTTNIRFTDSTYGKSAAAVVTVQGGNAQVTLQ